MGWLTSMTFQCRSIFNAIPSNEKFCQLIPPHGCGGLANITSLYSSRHLCISQQNIFSKLTQPIPVQSGRFGKSEVLCADLDISCIFYQNTF